MKSPRIFIVTLAFWMTGCSSLVLRPADFAWPIEDVLTVDQQGMVQEDRYGLSFNTKPLLYEETKDSVNVGGRTIRVIRNVTGYYFITGKGFKSVYMFAETRGGLKLKKKIDVSKEGLTSPAFNQRNSYIELVNGDDKPIMLTENGIIEEGKK